MQKRSSKSRAKAKDRKVGEIRGETILLLAIGLLVGFLPIVWSPSGLDQYRVPKDIVFGVGAIWVTTIFIATRQRFCWNWRSWEALLAIGLVYLIIHSLIIGRWEITLSASLWVLCGVGILWTLSGVGSIAFHRLLWVILALGSAINAVFAILQYYGYLPLLSGPAKEVLQGRYTPAGFVGEVDSGGFLFGLCSLMLLFPIVTARSFRLRVLSGILLLLNLAGLVTTQTVTALLATGAVLALWIPLCLWWVSRTRPDWRITLPKVALALCLSAAVIAALFAFSGSSARVGRVWAHLQEGDFALLTSGRYPVYVITWSMIKEKPFAGRGLNTFGADFFYYRADTEMAKLRILKQPGAWRQAHNECLQVWEELGLPGLALFLALFAIPVIATISFARRAADADTVYWAALLCLGALFVAVSSLAFFPFHLSLTALAILVLFANMRRLGRDTAPSPVRAFRPRSSAALLACIVVCVFAVYGGSRWWRANTEAGTAALLLERTVDSRVSTADRLPTVRSALRHLAQAEGMSPVRHEVHNLKGSACLLLGEYEQAAREYGAAASSIPSPEVLTNFAMALHATGQKDRAEEMLEKALRYNPAYRKAALALEYVQRNRD